MKNFLKKRKEFRLPSFLLIFLAIFTISIFGLQVSKIFAQDNSILGSSLRVKSGATITGPLKVSGGVGVGTNAPGSGLTVNGASNFTGYVSVDTPGGSQSGAIANVDYIDGKIATLPSCPPQKICPTCPSCPACNSCCGTSPPADPECMQFDTETSCSKPAPTALSSTCSGDSMFGGFVTPCVDKWVVKCCPKLTLPR